MKTQDPTKKDDQSVINAQASAAQGICDADATKKELTDEQLASVVGGKKTAPDLIKKS